MDRADSTYVRDTSPAVHKHKVELGDPLVAKLLDV